MQKRVEEKREQVINLYKNQGLSVNKVAESLVMTKETVRKVLRSENIEIRSQSNQQLLMNGSGSLKHCAFDILTEEALYWIGFLYADGYVREKSNRHLISIDLSTRDKEHLEKFKSFLNAGVSIRDSIRKRGENVYYTSIITVSSKQLFDRLTELGFTNNKTYDAVVHPDLLSHPAFWRGVFDGDGCISDTQSGKYQNTQVGLCGTKDTVQCFIEFVKDNNIKTDIIEARFKKGTMSNYETTFGGSVAEKVMTLLYKDATVYLDRKFEKYKELTK